MQLKIPLEFYIRVGSTTQPFKGPQLADIDRIDYMLKRREKPLEISNRILNRIEERLDFSLDTIETLPNRNRPPCISISPVNLGVRNLRVYAGHRPSIRVVLSSLMIPLPILVQGKFPKVSASWVPNLVYRTEK